MKTTRACGNHRRKTGVEHSPVECKEGHFYMYVWQLMEFLNPPRGNDDLTERGDL